MQNPTWIENDQDLVQLLEKHQAESMYGLDTEFHGERTYYPRLALVQIAWADEVALIDALAVDVRSLSTLLNSSALMIAHASSQDLAILDRLCGTVPSRLFDTQLAAGFLGLSTPSLGSLVDYTLQIHLEKGEQLADWTRRPLSAEQLLYAAADVSHLFDVYRELEQKLRAVGRFEWAVDECEQLRQRERTPADIETAWWRLKGNRNLRGAARGIAQVVTAWREQRAREIDRPLGYVLSDLAILGFANRPPKTIEQLRGTRGLEHRNIGDDVATQIMDAIKRGQNLPSEQLRLPPAPPDASPAAVVSLLQVWLGQLARDMKIDNALLATRADLQQFLGDPPSGSLTHGWRHEVVAEPIERLRSGQAALSLRGDQIELIQI